MKKTMFITSIVMVVVLAVALTTSSLAWFAAGGATSVTVSSFTIQAKNNAAAAGLELSNNGSSGWKTSSINLLTSPEGTWEVASTSTVAGQMAQSWRSIFEPMAPVGSIAKVDPTNESSKLVHEDLYLLLRDRMYSAETKVVDGTEKMADVGTRKTALEKDFYIRNTGESATNVTVTLTVSVDTLQAARSYNATLFVAIFDETSVVWTARQGETAASMTGSVNLIAFASSDGGNLQFCQPSANWAANTPSADINGQHKSITDFTIGTMNLEPAQDLLHYDSTQEQYVDGADGILEYTPHHLRLIAWFDGTDLNNQNSDTIVNISLSFGVPQA